MRAPRDERRPDPEHRAGPRQRPRRAVLVAAARPPPPQPDPVQEVPDLEGDPARHEVRRAVPEGADADRRGEGDDGVERPLGHEEGVPRTEADVPPARLRTGVRGRAVDAFRSFRSERSGRRAASARAAARRAHPRCTRGGAGHGRPPPRLFEQPPLLRGHLRHIRDVDGARVPPRIVLVVEREERRLALREEDELLVAPDLGEPAGEEGEQRAGAVGATARRVLMGAAEARRGAARSERRAEARRGEERREESRSGEERRGGGRAHLSGTS